MKGNLAFSAGGDEDENKDAAEAINAALNELVAAKPRSHLSAENVDPPEKLIIWDFADPAKGTAAQLKLFRALKAGSEYYAMPLKEKPDVKADSQEYRGVKLHSVSMKWDLDKMKDNLLGSEDAVKAMLHILRDGQKLWFGVVNRKYVQVSARDWPAAAKRLDAYFDKKGVIGDNKAFNQARANLPARASMVSLGETAVLAQTLGEGIYRFLKAQGRPVNPPPAPAKKIPSNFLGQALTFQPGQASGDLWLPGGAVRDFRRVFEPMFISSLKP
jgi:hypothetical protein